MLVNLLDLCKQTFENSTNKSLTKLWINLSKIKKRLSYEYNTYCEQKSTLSDHIYIVSEINLNKYATTRG